MTPDGNAMGTAPGAHRRPPAPHGGQVTATRWHRFEVVYTPKETRIYVYSPSMQRMDARGVQGQVEMRVRGNPQPFRYTAQEAADATGMRYLSIPVDVSRIRDGDMLVKFHLKNLPFREEPEVRFDQMFARSQPPAVAASPRGAGSSSGSRPRSVRVVALNDADGPLVKRQAVCPVTGSRLGEHGDPVKVLIDGTPLFLCCQGCVPKVKGNPGLYLAKAAPPSR